MNLFDVFDFQVQFEKHRDHVLVTHGLYSLCRHPSYVGWFYWSIGTQVWYNNFELKLLVVFWVWLNTWNSILFSDNTAKSYMRNWICGGVLALLQRESILRRVYACQFLWRYVQKISEICMHRLTFYKRICVNQNLAILFRIYFYKSFLKLEFEFVIYTVSQQKISSLLKLIIYKSSHSFSVNNFS